MPILFGLVAYIFFAFFYKYHLHYQEQLQMFLFTGDYWSDLMSRPGGLADYLGTFFTQFFYYSWLGALIISCMLVTLQQQVFMLANKLNRNLVFLPLTFIPSILFWGLLCDETFLLAGLVAAILTLFAVQIYIFFKSPILRICSVILMLPILYWLVGGIFGVFGIFCLILEWGFFKQFSKIQWLICIICFLLFFALPPFVTSYYIQYSLSRLWWGICYYRYPVVSPYPMLTIWISLLFILFIFKFLPMEMKWNVKVLCLFVQVIIILFLGNKLIRLTADWSKEEVMAYDYCVRMEEWGKVVDMGNHKDPNSPLTVACLNLALSKEGKMGDCMFRYFQNGPEGLLPTFQRDFTLPFVAGEVYYQLGFLNTSMRFAFEAMEAIPDYKKSSRAIKRIAEVNLLNGEYKVATKYLHLLQHTLFYSKWATETLKCIGNDKLIDQNLEWASLRKYRFTEDFLFSEQEKDQMLGLLFAHCTSNRMAYDYLMAYTLLTKDLDHFVQYFPLGRNLGYKEIPSHYQEALIFAWSNISSNLDKAPWPISNAVKQNLTNYARIYSTNKDSDPRLYESFTQTYWYYFHFRK
jgi:hypothetical protein